MAKIEYGLVSKISIYIVIVQTSCLDTVVTSEPLTFSVNIIIQSDIPMKRLLNPYLLCLLGIYLFSGMRKARWW